MIRWPFIEYSINVSPNPLIIGCNSNWRLSICRTVSGFKIATPSTVPSCRNASMKRVMSAAVVLSAPAGAAWTNSKSRGFFAAAR